MVAKKFLCPIFIYIPGIEFMKEISVKNRSGLTDVANQDGEFGEFGLQE